MKIPATCCLAAAILALAACQNTQNTSVEETHQNEYAAPAEEPLGVQRMGDYDFTDTLRLSSHTYLCHIHREASDSLPTVKDDFGTEFADNIYRLVIQRDGVTFFDRSFTKAAFAHLLTPDLLQRGVLDGMRADTTLTGLSFSVSISQPQSDIFQPFILSVDNAGTIAIARDTRMELE